MNGRAYYNEIDPYCCVWLRNLIGEGLIAPGDVDERSITEVQPSDLEGYTQCHFFAGIGGWSYALRLAGWPDERPVWTGSCPCQPFSAAGKRKGFADERHLWPVWFNLIRQRKPSSILGEQTARAHDWLALVRRDLEALGYAMGAMPIEAASAGADHLRDRYWFVAHAYGTELRQQSWRRDGANRQMATVIGDDAAADGGRALADADLSELQREPPARQQPEPQQDTRHRVSGLADFDSKHRRPGAGRQDRPEAGNGSVFDLEHFARLGWGEGWTEDELRCRGITAAVASIDGCQVIECPDGKWRRLPPPGVRWLGTRIPARIPRVRAFGNAIDPRPAAEFIKAAM